VPIVKCIYCKNKFFRSNGRFNEAKKFKWDSYCSIECQGNYRKRRKSVICENINCGKNFEKLTSEITTHNYCSRICAAITNNRKFPKRGPGFRLCKICSIKFTGQNSYCSQICFKKSKQRHKPEDLIESVKKLAKALGRIPAKREEPKLADACEYAFGSWNNAITAAGFTPNRSHDHRMYKRVRTKAKDGHLCDSISEAIIDNWLADHKIKHERDAAYPDSNHKADWAVNKAFIEYFGLAKDSPRYDRDIKTKKELCARHGIKLFSVFPADLYPKPNLASKLRNVR